jgi:hypothetical protein
MAIERNLIDVNQDTFDSAEAVVIALLKSNRSDLDLRRGTALRDLLIRAAAQFHAYNALLNDDLRNSQSLKVVAANPELADADTVDNILSNLGVIRRTGFLATGAALVTTSIQKDYFIPQNYTLQDAAGNIFATTQAFTVRAFEAPIPPNELELFPFEDTSGNFFFILPLQAQTEGVAGNIEQGTVLAVTGQVITGVETAAAYIDFTGGAPEESITDVLTRLPTALSQKALESRLSISARLQDEFSSVLATSSLGFGSDLQLRDKHNVFRAAMGSRVDIYVRSFREPAVLLLEKTATKVSDGVYTFTIAASEAPGYYLIRSITSIDSVEPLGSPADTLPVFGSFPFTDVRSTTNLAQTAHDFDPANGVVETAYTVFQEAAITVQNIPAVVVGGSPTFPDTTRLKVEIYLPPNLVNVQGFVDGDAVANLEADHVCRGAIPCFVTLQATLFRSKGVVLDQDAIKTAVMELINGKHFNSILTASQVSSVLHSFDIIRVGLEDTGSTGLRMQGRVRGADGVLRSIAGDGLDINAIRDPEALVAPESVVFTIDRRNIFLTEREI